MSKKAQPLFSTISVFPVVLMLQNLITAFAQT